MLNIFNMRYFELGHIVRTARTTAAVTQADLAEQAGLTRTTINQLEAGSCPDLGIKKVIRLLDGLGLELNVTPTRKKKRPDYLRMACGTANVSLREPITPDDLAQVFLTGKVPRRLRPHLRVVFDELPSKVLDGLMGQLGTSPTRALRVTKNAGEVARKIGSRMDASS